MEILGQLWLRRGWWLQMGLQLTGSASYLKKLFTVHRSAQLLTIGDFQSTSSKLWSCSLSSPPRSTSTYIGRTLEPTPSLSQTTRSFSLVTNTRIGNLGGHVDMLMEDKKTKQWQPGRSTSYLGVRQPWGTQSNFTSPRERVGGGFFQCHCRKWYVVKSFEILNGHCHSPSVVLEVPVQLKKTGGCSGQIGEGSQR